MYSWSYWPESNHKEPINEFVNTDSGRNLYSAFHNKKLYNINDPSVYFNWMGYTDVGQKLFISHQTRI